MFYGKTDAFLVNTQSDLLSKFRSKPDAPAPAANTGAPDWSGMASGPLQADSWSLRIQS